jgi:hypothetical protein
VDRAATLEELLAVERSGWDALCGAGGAEYYGDLMTGDALMVLANGMVMDRPTVMEALASSPPWHRFELEDPRLVEVGDDGVVLVYSARAWRSGDEAPFEAVMASVYVRRAGRWRLATYQQTPKVA